jgi:hypothetical protein
MKWDLNQMEKNGPSKGEQQERMVNELKWEKNPFFTDFDISVIQELSEKHKSISSDLKS